MDKKLYRIEEGKKICGVCGGLAKYLNMDSTVLRVLTILLMMAAGGGLIAYIVCALVIPEEPDYVEVN